MSCPGRKKFPQVTTLNRGNMCPSVIATVTVTVLTMYSLIPSNLRSPTKLTKLTNHLLHPVPRVHHHRRPQPAHVAHLSHCLHSCHNLHRIPLHFRSISLEIPLICLLALTLIFKKMLMTRIPTMMGLSTEDFSKNVETTLSTINMTTKIKINFSSNMEILTFSSNMEILTFMMNMKSRILVASMNLFEKESDPIVSGGTYMRTRTT